VYGSRAELKIRQIERVGIGIKGIVQVLYGTDFEVIPLQSCKWSFNAMIGRTGENIEVPGEVAAQVVEKAPEAPGTTRQFVKALR
jgi:hypothetical protein